MTTLAGKLLRIDLTRKHHSIEKIPESYYRKFISARGLGAKYLYDELKPGIDPFSPDNKLLMLIGALGATGLQGFSKWAAMTKSPLTGTIMRSYTGGNFGVWMKFAGYDLIIIEGKAHKLSYVYIDEADVQFLDANDLSGLDPRTLQETLKDRHGPKTESACIGPAGEKLVRYGVITSGERTASRGGMGAVMGSKRLKAIAINVRARKIAAFREKEFKALVRGQISILKTHPRRAKMNRLGTPYATEPYMKRGILPVRNFREGTILNVEEMSGEAFYEMKKEQAGCYGCMTKCGGMRDVKRGPFGGSQIDGPEYETIYALGSLLGITDKQFIIDANAMCDYYGVDTISAGVCMAFACELFERGIITAKDANGIQLNWGNKDAFLALIEEIGQREGLGFLLGEGVKRASEQIGGEADFYAIHIKGLELPGYEPRAVKGYGLSMATSNIGGSHMYGRPKKEMAGEVDPLIEKGKGPSIIQAQKEQAIEDSLIACSFGNSGLDFQKYSEFLVAATGFQEFAEVANLMEIGERIVCLERCFNIREGFTRKDDTLPKRMLREHLKKGGPANNQTFQGLEKLLDEYYEAAGYTKEGIPTARKLRDLGLEEIASTVS